MSHLQQVEKTSRRKGLVRRCSLRLHIKECNSGLPPNKPLQVILFGEEGYFLTEDRKERGPPDCYRLVEHSILGDCKSDNGNTGPGHRAAIEQVDIHEDDTDDCSSILDLSVHRTPTEDDGRSLSDSEHEDSSVHHTPTEDDEDS